MNFNGMMMKINKMRHFLVIMMILPCLYSFTGDTGQVITLRGKVNNATQTYLIIVKPGAILDTVAIGKDFTFSYSTEVTEPVNCRIVYNRTNVLPVYFSGGMKLTLTFDDKDMEGTAEFEGKGADKNTYLLAKTVNDKKIKASDRDLVKKDSTAFFAAVDKIRTSQNNLLDGFKKDDPRDNFWIVQRAENDFGWANKINDYPEGYQYFVDSTFKVTDNFYNRTNALEINDQDLIPSGEFQNYLSGFVDRKTRAKLKSLPDSSARSAFSLASLETAKSEISDVAVRDHYMASNLKGMISYRELGTLQEPIKFFRENCKTGKERADFEKELESWLKLEKGKQAFDFSGETVDKRKIKLSDLKGKYVYVDVWATWCGPCKYEIPFLLKLEEDYHNRNIVFLSYSIDSDRKAWETFIPEKGLTGLQLLGEKAWESKLIKNYKIFGVPTFMFFDPDGKIISVKMTRPSNKKTRETFDSMQGL